MAWCSMSLVSLKGWKLSWGYQIVISASKPGAMVPLFFRPYSCAGPVDVTCTNFCGVMRPLRTPPVNSKGTLVSTPGRPLGTYLNLPCGWLPCRSPTCFPFGW